MKKKDEAIKVEKKDVIKKSKKVIIQKKEIKESKFGYTKKEKADFIKCFSGTDIDRAKAFAALIPDINQIIDSDDTVYRRFFDIKYLEQGEILVLKKEDNIPAVCINENGEDAEFVVQGSKVFPPEFWNTAMNKIGLVEVATRQYDILSRTRDKVAFQLALKELKHFIKMANAAADWHNNIIDLFDQTKKDKFINFFKRTHIRNLIINKIKSIKDLGYDYLLIDPNSLATLESIVSKYIPEEKITTVFEEKYTQISDTEKVKMQHRFLLGLEILKTDIEDLPATRKCCLLLPKEKLGVLAIRKDLILLPADSFLVGKPTYGALYGRCEAPCLIKSNRVYRIKLGTGIENKKSKRRLGCVLYLFKAIHFGIKFDISYATKKLYNIDIYFLCAKLHINFYTDERLERFIFSNSLIF